MTRLSIFLLGPMHVVKDGQAIVDFKYDKVRALLAYLAVEADRPHRREFLAGMFWPGQSQEAAHRNLRQALSTLRLALDDPQPISPFLIIARDSIQFDPKSDVSLDVTTLANNLTMITAHRQQECAPCAFCAQMEVDASNLYRGDFLAEFSLRDSPMFDEWVLVYRERMRSWILDILSIQAELHLAAGEYKMAQQAAARQVEIDPLREKAHRQLMTAMALLGLRTTALTQFNACKRALEKELGVCPDEETMQLYQRIVSNSLRPSGETTGNSTTFPYH